MSDLFASTRAHDLPPRWDGEPVTWGKWHPPLAIFICQRGRGKYEPACCSRCKSVDNPTSASGRVAGLRRLTVFRCPECGHDTVVDNDTGEVWDLDPTDYQDEGSTAP